MIDELEKELQDLLAPDQNYHFQRQNDKQLLLIKCVSAANPDVYTWKPFWGNTKSDALRKAINQIKKEKFKKINE